MHDGAPWLPPKCFRQGGRREQGVQETTDPHGGIRQSRICNVASSGHSLLSVSGATLVPDEASPGVYCMYGSTRRPRNPPHYMQQTRTCSSGSPGGSHQRRPAPASTLRGRRTGTAPAPEERTHRGRGRCCTPGPCQAPHALRPLARSRPPWARRRPARPAATARGRCAGRARC